MSSNYTPWERVQISRSAERPTSLDYISTIFERYMSLHGDRYFGDDKAIVGGLASIGGRPVTVIGQQKGRSTKENIKRNFGMPSPEGYRKSLRLMKQAEKFHRPIILFVDTPGAFCGLEAEEGGVGAGLPPQVRGLRPHGRRPPGTGIPLLLQVSGLSLLLLRPHF